MHSILFIYMDNVLVNFQSVIDRLQLELIKKYEGDMDEVSGMF
jgi:5'-nucleotidase